MSYPPRRAPALPFIVVQLAVHLSADLTMILREPVDALNGLVGARSSGLGDRIDITFERDVTGGGDPSLCRVADASGVQIVTTATVIGGVVTRGMDRPLVQPATVSYGFALTPLAPWIEDRAGVSVAA